MKASLSALALALTFAGQTEAAVPPTSVKTIPVIDLSPQRISSTTVLGPNAGEVTISVTFLNERESQTRTCARSMGFNQLAADPKEAAGMRSHLVGAALQAIRQKTSAGYHEVIGDRQVAADAYATVVMEAYGKADTLCTKGPAAAPQ